MSDTAGLKLLPLRDLHEAAGAKFGGFAGWSMPVTYPLGVLKEHLHCRDAAGLFDISHMKLFRLYGPQAGAALARICPLDPGAIDEGRSKYTFLLNDKAGIDDDLIVTRIGSDRFMIVANAGNAEADEVRFRELANGLDCTVEPLDRVFLALQGPQAEAALSAAGIDAGDLVFMEGRELDGDRFVSRSGYTGEDGFEIAGPADSMRELAKRLVANDFVEWVGLAARDSLRLEAGLCLHGQDIGRETTPVEAGLMWAIPKSVRQDGNFAGADALRSAIEEGPRRKRVGLKAEGRQPVRAGTVLLTEDGREVGQVTSGGFGPSAGHPVAMGYVLAELSSPDTQLHAQIRSNRIAVLPHPLPFTPHRYRKG